MAWTRLRRATVGFGIILSACGGSDPEPAGEPDAGFIGHVEPPVECEGADVVAFAGNHRQIVSSLRLGERLDGFDLDDDYEGDNAFGGLSETLDGPMAEALSEFRLMLPMEFFDLDDVEVGAEDECAKFAIYDGLYRLDADDDGETTAQDTGDCNDHLITAGRGQAELADNGIDDDCDGLADETEESVKGVLVVTPSADVSDADKDGVTLADGDCDDTNDAIYPGLAETCGDGLDNNCDGVADWTVGAAEAHCSPFDNDLDPLTVADTSFSDSGEPLNRFRNGSIALRGSIIRFDSNAPLFSLKMPLPGGEGVDLTMTRTTVAADFAMTPMGWRIETGRLGGALDLITMDKVRGLTSEELGLSPEQSFADLMIVGQLNSTLRLRRGEPGTAAEGCFHPDVDIDEDGNEAFCDTIPDDGVLAIDKCIDGDGTIVLDTADTECTAALDDEGHPRFVDGISILFFFETVPAELQ